MIHVSYLLWQGGVGSDVVHDNIRWLPCKGRMTRLGRHGRCMYKDIGLPCQVCVLSYYVLGSSCGLTTLIEAGIGVSNWPSLDFFHKSHGSHGHVL
ncbi:hypothetical protein K449DRAFT_80445 [Hypoxylon sp. EC38]|nr:hypothetical protein K449DRAFT_80445 [Hypoxylon sp. EC38]